MAAISSRRCDRGEAGAQHEPRAAVSTPKNSTVTACDSGSRSAPVSSENPSTYDEHRPRDDLGVDRPHPHLRRGAGRTHARNATARPVARRGADTVVAQPSGPHHASRPADGGPAAPDGVDGPAQLPLEHDLAVARCPSRPEARSRPGLRPRSRWACRRSSVRPQSANVSSQRSSSANLACSSA